MVNMDVTIRDNNFNIVGIVDDYESIIWTDRYNTPGDFQLYGTLDSTIAEYCKIGYFVNIPNSDRTMVIETISAESNPRQSNKITVTGRSVESILDRRIIWGTEIFLGENNKVQDAIREIITHHVISPAVAQRAIPNFSFIDNSDPALLDMTFAPIQYDGDNVLEVITNLCQTYNIGFKVINSGSSFTMSIFNGVNRAADQTDYPVITFSEEYDNITESRFDMDKTPYKNVALVDGDDIPGTDPPVKERVPAGDEMASGLDRYEMKVEAGISRNYGDQQEQQTIPTTKYTQMIRAKGIEELDKLKDIYKLDGKIDTNSLKYGVDYYVGDTMQFVGLFGINTKVRITEFIRCLDGSGYQEYPSYVIVND
ncbi:MAG: siphovirus ReqiPepy6 Gp37-like family protein [Pseudobutyrivibrio sp.]|nr:siphovirus ReqiPepy6 Gp37-like family protein [Pseudobutyrivibrio sp.]